MSLRHGIEAIKRQRKDLTLFNIDPDDPIADEISAYFEAQNVDITVESTVSTAPEGIAVLSDIDTVLTIVPVSMLRELVRGTTADPDTLGINDAKYEPLLEHLKETTFTSYDREQLLYASQEIEDRARRVGSGTIYAGFQRLSVMKTQVDIYADLARRGIETHTYGVPDVTVPDVDVGRIHPSNTDEIAETWFVVFDSGDDESQKSALLAEECEPGEFYGAWTYDAAIVDSITNYLERTYTTDSDRWTSIE